MARDEQRTGTTILSDDVTAEATARSDATELAHQPTARAASAMPIERGADLLGLYRVESDAIEGGMGKVWRVRHTGWNAELAMKQPRPELFQREKQKADFIRECESWFNLGQHPQIVSCYYVREIGGVPSIFAEWMDGGSLKEWIQGGKLYEGDALRRILDIAIQFARGLRYAHERGLIHQDVKPDNLLLTQGGDAKVGDFGIAKARAVLSARKADAPPDATMVSGSGAYTPAYCSPEQMNCKPLTRRTDLYSWAVSVLEMCLGERLWQSGAMVGHALSDYLGMDMRVPMPDGLPDLLGRCLSEIPDNRPHDFAALDAGLLSIYAAATGEAYPRPVRSAATDTPGNLNNRALSFLDLAKPKEAEKCWTQALTLSPGHAASLYNQSIHLWRAGKINDLQVLQKLSDNRSDMSDYFLCMVHIARGDAVSATACLQSAKVAPGGSDAIARAWAEVKQLTARGEDGCPLRNLPGPHKSLTSLSISTDGRYALSSSYYDTAAQLWDLETGQRGRKLGPSGIGRSESALFAPDGTTALISSQITVEHTPDGKAALARGQGTLTLYDVASGKALRSIDGLLYPMCYSPDGRRVLIRTSDSFYHTPSLYDTDTWLPVLQLVGHKDSVNAACFTPDGRHLLTGGWDNARYWDAQTGEILYVCKGHGGAVNAVCISPDGRTALTGSDNGKIMRWNLETGARLRTYTSIHDANIEALCYLPGGDHVLSGSADGTLRLFSADSGQCIRTFERAHNWVKRACVSPDGRTALSWGKDEMLRAWRLPCRFHYEALLADVQDTDEVIEQEAAFTAERAEVQRLVEHGDMAGALRLLSRLAQMPNWGDSEACYAMKREVMRYCPPAPVIGHKARIIHQPGLSVCLSPDACTAFMGNLSDNSIKRLDVLTQQVSSTLRGHKGRVLSLCASPDGTRLLSGSIDKTARLWDLGSNKCVLTFEGHADRVGSVQFSVDARTALTGSDDGTFRLWDCESGQCLRAWGKAQGENGRVACVRFSPDGCKALTGSTDGMLKEWSLQTGELLRADKPVQGGDYISQIHAVCYSPDGKRALAGHRNGQIKIWDLASWRVVGKLNGHHSEIWSLQISPNGQYALSSASDATAMLWDLTEQRCVYTFSGHKGPVFGACFSLDGARIASISEHMMIAYDLDLELRFPGWCEWDDAAAPYARIFKALHPAWTEADFAGFITELRVRGLGYLKPDGVRAYLTHGETAVHTVAAFTAPPVQRSAPDAPTIKAPTAPPAEKKKTGLFSLFSRWGKK